MPYEGYLDGPSVTALSGLVLAVWLAGHFAVIAALLWRLRRRGGPRARLPLG